MIRRFNDSLFFGWDILNDWRSTWTMGDIVDTEKYNVIDGKVVPRQSYKDEQIKQIKEKIRALEEEKAKLEKTG